jgi:polysaccharide chain length determinant protein (PEP-CTERM system associated)
VIPGKRYTPEELIALAWARKWVLLACIVTGAVSAYSGSLLVKNLYQSETLILVVPQKVPDEYVRPTITSRLGDRLSTITQQIQSRSSLERFITELNLYPDLRDKVSIDSLVVRMRDDIKVDVVRGDSFRVRYTSEDPKTAQVVASKLASAYIEENLNDRGIAARNTTSFLKRELNEALIRLQQQEKRLEDYRRAYAGELPSQLPANQDALGHARMQLRATTDQIASARDRRGLLDSEAADLLAQRAPAPLTGAPDSVSHEPNPRATIEQQLTTARATFAEQSARFTPDHPDYRAAARKVRELERDLARYNASVQPESATATVPGPTAVDPAMSGRQNRIRQLRNEMASLDRQIVASQVEEARLKGEIDVLQRRVDVTPTRETELVQLTRDYETIKDMYTSLLVRSENSALAEKLEEQKIGEQFKILDQAKVPGRPVSPNRVRLTFIGALGGLCLAVAVIGLLEYSNASLRSEEDVLTCLGLPVIAVIPIMSDEVAAPRGRVKRLVGALTGT